MSGGGKEERRELGEEQTKPQKWRDLPTRQPILMIDQNRFKWSIYLERGYSLAQASREMGWMHSYAYTISHKGRMHINKFWDLLDWKNRCRKERGEPRMEAVDLYELIKPDGAPMLYDYNFRDPANWNRNWGEQDND